MRVFFFFFNDTATTEIYTLSLHDALPICSDQNSYGNQLQWDSAVESRWPTDRRSEEHTSELQSRLHLVCRLLLEKKKTKKTTSTAYRPTTHNQPLQRAGPSAQTSTHRTST